MAPLYALILEKDNSYVSPNLGENHLRPEAGHLNIIDVHIAKIMYDALICVILSYLMQLYRDHI